ncbi:hypothetical protein KQH51_04735 [bacterium]|nr:hypothetical protein [bacterium]MCB2202222.1 hypothetical protein [bacterium]
MKKTIIAAAVITLLVASNSFAIDAFGSSFGNLTTARPVGAAKANIAGGVGIADATSFFGAVTYGLSTYMDGRLKLGLVDGDGTDTEFTFGADIKWQMWDYAPGGKYPFDMAIGGLFEYVSSGNAGYDVSLMQIGGFALGSYPIALKSGGSLSPYGRLNIRVERASIDTPFGDDSESNLKFGFHGGVAWAPSPTTTLYGEFQLDGNDGVFFGIDFNVM